MLKLSYEQQQKFKRHWLTIAFIGGFVLDALTLGRVDQWFALASLSAHVLNAGLNLALLYAATADRLPEFVRMCALRYSPFLVQFSFGSLLSGTLVFYAQSGSWSVTWPFLLIVLAVMVGNELVHDRVQRLILNLTIFFLGIFSFCVLFIPVALGKMGWWVFIGSGMVALAAIALYIKILRLIIPKFIELHLRGIVFSLGMIFCALNFLYFSNIIPPIPLSLKHIDIYHAVAKAGEGSYVLTYEKAPWFKFWRDADTTYRRRAGEGVYCFASVFAPTSFTPTVVHHWEVYDPGKGWVTHSEIPYRIEGGGDEGYRGYSHLTNIWDGTWRCTVETEQGQAIGRETFTIVQGEPQKLVTVQN